MSQPQDKPCSHPDIHRFDGMRCCLSCGLTLYEQDTDSQTLLKHDPDARQENRPYRYKRLNHELGREIRLMRLLPGFANETLRCSIRHVNLDDNPTYEAVSYTWATQDGETRMTGELLCQDNTCLKISENCQAVLRRIRAKGHARTLWLDMACIDQQHLAERNHQVNMMDRIYRQAQLVIVDLGDDDEPSRALFDGIMKRHNNQLATEAQIQQFLSRRWFSRGWVLQEVALAKYAIVHCGHDTANWDDFKDFVRANCATHHLPAALQLNLHWDNQMDVLSLIDVLATTFSCTVADPRDKIYSLLGLCQPELRQQLPVDYTITISQLYLQLVALYILRKNDWLSSELERTFSRMDRFDFDAVPSWFPTSVMSCRPNIYQSVPRGSIRHVHARSTGRDLVQLRMGLLKVSARCLGKIRFVKVVDASSADASIMRINTLDPAEYELKIWSFINIQMIWQSTTMKATEARSKPVDIRFYNYYKRPEYIQLVHRALREQDELESERSMTSYQPCQRNDSNQVTVEGRSMEAQDASTRQTVRLSAEVDPTTCETVERPSDAKCLVDSMGADTVRQFFRAVGSTQRHVELFGTDHCLGLGPRDVQVGDTVWLLEGRRDVFVLRHCPQDQPVDVTDMTNAYPPSAGEHRYEIVGSCFYYSQETVRGPMGDQNSHDAWQEIDLI